MSDTKHTPLPWVIREEVNGYAYIGHEHPESPPVAMIPHESPEDRANVALILTAVNAHADLLAACEAFVAADNHDGITLAFNMASAAIAKAKGGAA